MFFYYMWLRNQSEQKIFWSGGKSLYNLNNYKFVVFGLQYCCYL